MISSNVASNLKFVVKQSSRKISPQKVLQECHSWEMFLKLFGNVVVFSFSCFLLKSIRV